MIKQYKKNPILFLVGCKSDLLNDNNNESSTNPSNLDQISESSNKNKVTSEEHLPTPGDINDMNNNENNPDPISVNPKEIANAISAFGYFPTSSKLSVGIKEVKTISFYVFVWVHFRLGNKIVIR